MPNDSRIDYENLTHVNQEKLEPEAVWCGIVAVIMLVIFCLEILRVI